MNCDRLSDELKSVGRHKLRASISINQPPDVDGGTPLYVLPRRLRFYLSRDRAINFTAASLILMEEKLIIAFIIRGDVKPAGQKNSPENSSKQENAPRLKVKSPQAIALFLPIKGTLQIFTFLNLAHLKFIMFYLNFLNLMSKHPKPISFRLHRIS